MNHRRHSLPTLLALLALVGSIVVAVPVAAAQTAGLDQYQPNPGNSNPSGGSGDPGGPGESGAPPDGAAAGGGVVGGSAGPGGGGDARGGSGSRGDEGGGVVGVPTSAGPAEGDLGEIPFTDYPMTPLLLGVILLVAAGLIARLVTHVAARSRSTSPTA